jgi:hypothetical protein
MKNDLTVQYAPIAYQQNSRPGAVYFLILRGHCRLSGNYASIFMAGGCLLFIIRTMSDMPCWCGDRTMPAGRAFSGHSRGQGRLGYRGTMGLTSPPLSPYQTSASQNFSCTPQTAGECRPELDGGTRYGPSWSLLRWRFGLGRGARSLLIRCLS